MTEETKLPIKNLPQEQSSIIDNSETLTQKQDITKIQSSVNFWALFIIIAILTLIYLGISAVTDWNSTCMGILAIPYVALIVAFISGFSQQNTAIEKATTAKEALNEARKQYHAKKEQLNVPEKAKVITYRKASAKSPIRLANDDYRMYIWKAEDGIHFFPCAPETIRGISLPDLVITVIPINQIEYFSKQGEIFRETKVSGGDGGGSSIGGAVAGGLIAGEVGAIIGSRKKTNEIKSELVTHDTRETLLNYFDNGERHSLIFNTAAHQIFDDLIPEKEFNIVSAIKSSEIIKNQINAEHKQSVTDQLRELAQLRDEGIITENDFNEKKKQLLDKIS
jgi:hypothetical protein